MDTKLEDLAQENLLNIKGEFANLLSSVCEKFKAMIRLGQIDIKELHSYLKTLFAPGKCIPNSALLNDMFDAITENELWDFWHYSPLQRIITKFGGNDTDLSTWISNYREALSGYKVVTKIKDYIAATESQLPLSSDDLGKSLLAKYDQEYYQQLMLKVDVKVTEKTLQYVSDLWTALADRFLLPCPTVLLDSITEGCATITWFIPTHIVARLVERACSNPNFFQEHKIVWATVNGDYIYREHHSIQGQDEPLLVCSFV